MARSPSARRRRRRRTSRGRAGCVARGALRYRLETPRCAEDDDRLALLVFGSGLDLFAAKLEGDAVLLARLRHEMKRFPGHGDLAAADAEEAAEVDDGGARLALAVDDHVDDAAHALVAHAAHLATHDALHLVAAEHGDGRRAMGITGGRRGLGPRG